MHHKKYRPSLLAIIFALIVTLDAAWTAIAIKSGLAVEQNPLLNALMSQLGECVVLAIKAVTATGAIFLIDFFRSRHPESRLIQLALPLVTVAYLALYVFLGPSLEEHRLAIQQTTAFVINPP